ncbi:bifunctional epoxide hydrolase 2 [Brachyhypopomus gauderio]|uniref:bifunctional epoxide hydrolase 2 n=1 Tax=Brachyhypopomus gauderio TaxID=698409 RepID=UPI0040418402
MGKVVLFGLWGGVITPHPLESFQKVESSMNIPRGFISNTIVKGGSENALVRAEDGKLTFVQMLSELEAEFQKEAGSQCLTLPAEFSAQKLFDEVRRVEFSRTVLDAATSLRRHGIPTCVLANIWVDDSLQRDSTAKVLSVLASHFDLVLRSCDIGARLPEPKVFQTALDKLGVKPDQAVWLDVDEHSVRAAESLGMTAVHITDVSEALKKLEKFAGIELSAEKTPRSCTPEEVIHGYVTIKPGVKIHYVEMGDGPPVLLCHGFPECWFSWRYQIPALADAGFRVIAPDMKGYGDSTAPADIEEYSQEKILQDLVTFLDKLGLAQVTVVGHDWGGMVVWNMAQCYPERLRAVASLNTPLFPVDPHNDPMERLKTIPIFEYQIYFQKPGVAESELEKDLARTFKLLFTASDETDTHPQVDTTGVCKKGGLFVGLPEDVPRSALLSEAALQYYVQQYSKQGFRGPLNWYRNVERNWRWMCSRPRGKILIPALMVTAQKDRILLPVFTTGMENMIPNLTRGNIENCGHWTQMERPSELNKTLISWLTETHQKASISVSPKL